MKKSVIAATIAAVVVLGSAGTAVAVAANQGTAPEPTSSAVTTPEAVAEPSSSSEPEPTAATPVAITAPGEVCDIEARQTIDCSVNFPDIGFTNAVKRVATEPLISMSDDAMIALGHQACDQLTAGAAPTDVNLVGDVDSPTPGWNNSILVNNAPMSYCHEFADPEVIAPYLPQE